MGVGAPIEEIPPKAFKRAPFTKPPFTHDDLRKAIPPHCFQRSIPHSFLYLFYDVAAVFTLYHVATDFIPLLPIPLRYLAWPVYWVAQGCVLVGISEIAHGCGHHSFSDHEWLDDVVGLLLFSPLLIPYFSFKFSHGRHHANMGSIGREEALATKRRDALSQGGERIFQWLRKTPFRLIIIVGGLLFGVQLSLTVGFGGRQYNQISSLLDPWGPIFNRKQRLQVIISDIFLAAALYTYYQIGVTQGWEWFLCVYGGPYVVHNALAVMMVSLSHMHPALPRYDADEWDWLRGSLSTVDRDWGVLNHTFHHMPDLHVVHHLFPKMPHYHLQEATHYVRPILGEYYQRDTTPIYKALFREVQCFAFVQKDNDVKHGGVFWFAIDKS
nr:PREDICTED: delta(12)-acyl-lipid-desaturase-like [Bemisia tabaci]WQH19950.1 delta12 fatty acid desaturase [Bemisia tabaci]